MSVVISFDTKVTADVASDSRRTRRRRVMWGAGTVVALLICGAAAPMPLRSERNGLMAQVEEFTEVIDTAAGQRTEMEGFELEIAAMDNFETLKEAWFDTVPDTDIKWMLELVASRCGVTLATFGTEDMIDPMAEEGESEIAAAGATQVLGVALDPDEAVDEDESVEWDPEAEAAEVKVKPIDTLRLTLDGRGPLTSIMLFAGLLRATEAPVRVRTFDVTRFGDTYTFVITADRLRPPTVGLDDL